MTEEKTTTTEDTAVDPRPTETEEAPTESTSTTESSPESSDSTSDSASDSAAGETTAAAGAEAAEGGSGKKSWRSRSRAGKSEKAEKPPKEKKQKAEKPEKEPKAPRQKKEKEPVAEKKKRRSVGSGIGASLSQVRLLVARLVWIVCLVFALALAITALLIALRANADNEAVQFIVSFADKVDLGIFDLRNPIKDFDTDEGPARDIKTALFNYGIGAIIWLIIGRVGDRVIRP